MGAQVEGAGNVDLEAVAQAHERLVHGGAPGSPLDLHRFTHPDLALLDLGCLLAGGSNTKVSRTPHCFPVHLEGAPAGFVLDPVVVPDRQCTSRIWDRWTGAWSPGR